MSPSKKITLKYFTQRTGRKPQHDDLERVNCKKAGTPGHYLCGWNEKAAVPRFMSLEPSRIIDPIVHLETKDYFSLCFTLAAGDVRADNTTKDKTKVTCSACKKLIK
jgi:hypothetical protein